MTITLGWWLIPALITFGLFGWAFTREYEGSSGWSYDPMPFVCYGGATIGSLLAWVVYLSIRLVVGS